jgi:hypothetical protein
LTTGPFSAELDTTSPATLRASLLRRGNVHEWLRMGGMSLEDEAAVSSFGLALSRVQLEASKQRAGLEICVLDWSQVECPTAEALAFLPVLIGRFHSLGITTYVCAPSKSGVSARLVAPDEHPSTSLSWVDSSWGTGSDPGECKIFPFDFATWQSAHAMVNHIEAVASVRRADVDHVNTLVALVIESVQNVRSHSAASAAAGSVVVLGRRRPPRLQVGIADNGIGIARALLSKGAKQSLAYFSDATVTDATLEAALSGRTEEGVAAEMGGGFSRLVREFVARTNGAVAIRSGSAFVTRGVPRMQTKRGKAHLTAGFGTQIRFELPLKAT